MQTRILAVDDSDLSLRLIKETLSKAGHQVATASSGQQALRQVDELKPDLIILDVVMPEMDGYQVCRQLRNHPATARLPIMMLTVQDSPAEKIKGFQAGADDFMTKPFKPTELQTHVHTLLNRATPPLPEIRKGFEGKTIGVFSLRGGVGVSTIATNLAIGLTQLWNQPAMLVDLALTAGHIALMFNVSPRTTWGDLAQVKLADLDSRAVNQVVIPHGSGVRVLLAPRRAEQRELLTCEKISKVLGLLKQSYSYVVADLPHDVHEMTLEGLDHMDEILLVLAPELASVASALAALEIFDNLGYSKDRIHLVLNRITDRRDWTQEMLEQALQRPIQLVVPYAPDIVGAAIDNGTPLVVDQSDTLIGSVLEDLAFLMSKEQDRQQHPIRQPRVATRRRAHSTATSQWRARESV